MPEILHGNNLIAGRRSAQGADTFSAFDPTAEADLAPMFHAAAPGEIDEACEAALSSVPTLSNPGIRARFLREIAAQIQSCGDALLERASAETGLPRARLEGERGRTTGQLELFANLAESGSWMDVCVDHAIPDRLPIPKPDLRRTVVALGPVAVFGASNFPLAFSVAGGDTASAFGAGCPVVAKAHPAHPGTSEMVGEAICRAALAAGLPPGVFSMVHGGAEVGKRLIEHPAIAAVGFTGSQRAGVALAQLAAYRPIPIPVFAEMGSVNPQVLMPAAAAERGADFADSYVKSLTMGVGQFCTNPGLLFGIAGEDFEHVLDSIAAQLRTVPPQPMLTPAIAAAFSSGIEKLRAHKELEMIVEGNVRGTYASPFFFAAKSSEIELDHVSEEVFGPVGIAIQCDSLQSLLRLLLGLPGQLTGAVHWNSSDGESAKQVADALGKRAGRVISNGFPTGLEVCHSTHHGGPFPAASDPRFTSVGAAAILRWVRPICYQGFPDGWLPEELKEANPVGLARTVDGKLTTP